MCSPLAPQYANIDRSSAPTRSCPKYVLRRVRHEEAPPCPWCATAHQRMLQQVDWLVDVILAPGEHQKAWYLREENQAFAQRERERQ